MLIIFLLILFSQFQKRAMDCSLSSCMASWTTHKNWPKNLRTLSDHIQAGASWLHFWLKIPAGRLRVSRGPSSGTFFMKISGPINDRTFSSILIFKVIRRFPGQIMCRECRRTVIIRHAVCTPVKSFCQIRKVFQIFKHFLNLERLSILGKKHFLK